MQFACKGSNTIAFTLPAGQATYVGDLLLDETDAGVVARLSIDPPNVQRYLERSYPTLTAKLRVLPAREKRVANARLGSQHSECLLPRWGAKRAKASPSTPRRPNPPDARVHSAGSRRRRRSHESRSVRALRSHPEER